MAGPTTNIVVQSPKVPDQSQQSPNYAMANLMPQVSGEGIKLVDRLIDPQAIYMSKLSIFLYNATLTQSPIVDPESPMPGFKLNKLKTTEGEWKGNTNLQGYLTISQEVLMALSEDGSITRFPKDFKLSFFAARQTMSIISMMCANRDEWEIDNPTIIYPFGLTVWKAIVATLSRGMQEEGKRTLMDLLVHPNLWFTERPMADQPVRDKWFKL